MRVTSHAEKVSLSAEDSEEEDEEEEELDFDRARLAPPPPRDCGTSGRTSPGGRLGWAGTGTATGAAAPGTAKEICERSPERNKRLREREGEREASYPKHSGSRFFSSVYAGANRKGRNDTTQKGQQGEVSAIYSIAVSVLARGVF